MPAKKSPAKADAQGTPTTAGLEQLKANRANRTSVAPEDTDQTQGRSKVAPHTVNSSLASDRMKSLLKDHQAMGARPK